MIFYFFFFFQAEDGIRDVAVTGVQTCALPISLVLEIDVDVGRLFALGTHEALEERSEERRVGKEGRCRGGPEHEKNKRDETDGGGSGGVARAVQLYARNRGGCRAGVLAARWPA